MTKKSGVPGSAKAGAEKPARPPGSADPGTESSPPPDEETAAAAEPAPEDSKKPDPTRYGDWEKNGRCIDF